MPYPEIYPLDEESYHPTALTYTMFLDAIDRAVAQTIIDYLQASDATMRVGPARGQGERAQQLPLPCRPARRRQAGLAA
jgi:hypothetical protein